MKSTGNLFVVVLWAGLLVSSCVSSPPAVIVEPLRDNFIIVTEKNREAVSLLFTPPAGRGWTHQAMISPGPLPGPADALEFWLGAEKWGDSFAASRISLSGQLPPDRLSYVNIVSHNEDGRVALYRPSAISGWAQRSYEPQVAVEARESVLPADWWRGAVFYQVFVRSFSDSDGDGHGDLRGLIERLPYLKELGIGGIWMLPILESSDNDHGYATIDYFDIEDDYGNFDDFFELVDSAHNLGMGVILDFVVNHCSDSHPFFVDSARGPHSPYRDWFVWEHSYPGKWSAPDAAEDAWHRRGDGYYFGSFWSGMPDWNYRNPSVEHYLQDVFRFWLNAGVDGFRFDAVHHLIENGPGNVGYQSDNHRYYARYREIADQYDNIFLICENQDPAYINERQFHSGFAFGANHFLLDMIDRGNAEETSRMLTALMQLDGLDPSGTRGSVLAPFLSNHDLFAGLRPVHRFAGNRGKARSAAAVLLTIPGVPFVYYGEEIGMTSQNSLQRDYSLRSPMQWSDAPHGGFSDVVPYRALSPDWTVVNVASQIGNENSMLEHYRRLIRLRNSTPALRYGGFSDIPNPDPSVYAFRRYYRRGGDAQSLRVYVNFSGSTWSGRLEAGEVLAGDGELGTTRENETTAQAAIPGYGYLIVSD